MESGIAPADLLRDPESLHAIESLLTKRAEDKRREAQRADLMRRVGR